MQSEILKINLFDSHFLMKTVHARRIPADLSVRRQKLAVQIKNYLLKQFPHSQLTAVTEWAIDSKIGHHREAQTTKTNHSKSVNLCWGKKLVVASMGVSMLQSKLFHYQRHITTGFVCAIKRISKKFVKSKNIVNQMIREIKIQSCLDHPNIIKMYGVSQD